MCTVTYLPISRGQFVLTHNRDVEPTRFAQQIVLRSERKPQIIFPQDPWAGGTWIAASEHGRCFSIMNGAFKPHMRLQKYRMSRGQLSLKIFNYLQVEDFFEEVDLVEIEPFTMIVMDNNKIFEFRWDGERRFLQSKNPDVPHIWAAAPLYDNYWQDRRRKWYEEWLARYPNPGPQEMMTFHKSAGDGDPAYDMVMQRPPYVATVSITQIGCSEDQISIHLQSLASSIEVSQSIKLRKAMQ